MVTLIESSAPASSEPERNHTAPKKRRVGVGCEVLNKEL
jgi:hypothetical protein